MKLSHAQIKIYLDCPRKWRLRYIDKIREPLTLPMLFGSCFHKAIEYNYRQKISTHEDLATQDVVTFFISSFEKHTLRNGHLFKELTRGQVELIGVKMITSFMGYVAPQVQPLYVEYPITVNVNGVTVTGRLDVITTDRMIIDNKSSLPDDVKTDEYIEKLRDTDTQLPLYSLLYRSRFGEKESSCQWNISKVSKDGKVVSWIQPPKKNNPAPERMEATIVNVADGIAMNRFDKRASSTCDNNCPYKEHC